MPRTTRSHTAPSRISRVAGVLAAMLFLACASAYAFFQVPFVAMPAEIFAWVGDYVENNYRPQPEKRFKPRSFVHPKDRV